MDAAVVHGNFLEKGGAEVVSRELASLFDIPIYYGFGLPEEELTTEDIDHISLFNDSRLSFLKDSILFRDAYYALQSQHIEELYDYDVLFFSKNELGWFVPKDEQVVLYYLHTTPRTPYDLFHLKGDGLIPRMYSAAARVGYLPNTKYPDMFIANSELVRRRAKRYWGIPDHKIEVVYPPTEVSNYYSADSREDYYLTYSRLVADKRIDEIVRAFEDLDAELVVGGSGEEEDHLKDIAPENVTFVGYMDEEEKVRRLSEAKGLVFNAQNEDFGLIPVEAFASGCPVIGVREGFTKYQIVEGGNGISYERGVDNLRNAIHTFESEGVEWSSDRIQEFSTRFSKEQFQREIKRITSEVITETEIDPFPDVEQPRSRDDNEEVVPDGA